jgi:hypothetical protein
MFIALIHWRIKPDEESKKAFILHWNTSNSISNRKGLIAEFVSDTLPMANFPYITWHLDPESLGNFKSYVTIGLWADAADFQEPHRLVLESGPSSLAPGVRFQA